MRIRVWFNVGEKDPAKKWVVQVDDMPLRLYSAVTMLAPSTFKTGPETPSGWCEAKGMPIIMGDGTFMVVP